MLYVTPLKRGNFWLSSHAPAKAEAEWPDGNDHVPGFLPMTIAWMIVMNGRRRLKYALIGCSTSTVVIVRGIATSRNISLKPRRLNITAMAEETNQAAPPLKIT